MSKKNQFSYFNPLTAKEKYMEEAFEYFKKREKLDPHLDFDTFNKIWGGSEMQERWGAYRHTYTSAAFTKNFGKDLAKLYGDANEWKQIASIKPQNILKEGYNLGNTPKDRHMDLKNNAAGRKIASKNSNLNLLDEVYYALDHDPDIVLNQHINNDKPYKDTLIMNSVWKLADKGYENKDKVNSFLKGGIEYVKTLKINPKISKRSYYVFVKKSLKNTLKKWQSLQKMQLKKNQNTVLWKN